MKSKIFWSLVAAFNIGMLVFVHTYTHADVSPPPIQCESGYYLVDDVCRLEPTGCPFAEGIPIDSDKCVPPASDPTSSQNPNNEPDAVTAPVVGKN